MRIQTVLIKTPTANFNGFLNVDEVYTTQDRFHAILLAEKACLEGAKTIIVAAGDGTINETINGISRANCLDKVTLGIERNGSGNDLARSLGIFSHRDSVTALGEGKTVLIDLGRATYVNSGGELETRIFDNFAGVGFDAESAKAVENHKWAKKADYLVSLMQVLLTYTPKPIDVEVDGQSFGNEMRYFVNFANGAYAGRGIKLSPDSQLDDGQFNLLIAGNVSKPEAFSLIPRFYMGTHISHKKIEYFPAKTVTINADNLPVHLDGEVVGVTPVTFEVMSKALRIIYLKDTYLSTNK